MSVRFKAQLCCSTASSTVFNSFQKAMKLFFLIVSLLALSSRLHNVQGVRVGYGSVSEGHAQKFQGKSYVVQRVKDVVIKVAAAVREEAHPLSAGRNRKLATKTTPAFKKVEGKTNSSKEASGIGNEHFRVKTSPVSEEGLDMAEMDYSPAKKRSPIHN